MAKYAIVTLVLAVAGCASAPVQIDPAREKRSICKIGMEVNEQRSRLQEFGTKYGIENISCDIRTSKFNEEMAAACANEPSTARTAEIQRIRIAFELDSVSCDGGKTVFTWEKDQ